MDCTRENHPKVLKARHLLVTQIHVVLSGLTEQMINRPPDLRPGLIHAITS